MICSMRAVQPYSPVTRQHGEDSRRLETTTFSTLLSSTSLISLQRPSVLAFSSSHFFLRRSRNGEFSTAVFDSPPT